MPMNQKYLLGFAKYQSAVSREMYEFTKYSDKFITDPQVSMVAYHVLIETLEGRAPSQTDLIYDLNLPEYKLRNILKTLLDLKYIQFVDGNDSRFKHYQATESLKYGVEVHVARHVITILETAKALKIPVIGMMKSMIDKGLGKYKGLPAYGQFNLETIKDIMATIESKESQD